jgi:hypothetical protein
LTKIGPQIGTLLTSRLIVEENEEDPIVQSHDAERDNKNHLTNVQGQLRCDDEMLLAMLDVTLGNLVSDGFDQGRWMGCDEEKKRTVA